ncbi:MAG: CBS domain-containing protein, partial [Phycisphaerales bacterium]|nr:CBS domain-containing protein [Phycisphaerales bacterium]
LVASERVERSLMADSDAVRKPAWFHARPARQSPVDRSGLVSQGGAPLPNSQPILEKKGADVATVDRKTTVLGAAKAMNLQRIGAVVVTDGDRVVGIFTERDILNRIVAAGKDPKTTRVEEVMTSPVACRRETRLAALWQGKVQGDLARAVTLWCFAV